MCVLSRAAHVRAPLRHRGAVLDQAATAVILDLQRVRSAIARNACKHLLSDDALEPPPNLLKAVACIRNGKWCSLHWRYLIDLEDKGTPADPLKSFKGDNGRGAENFSLCVNRAIAAIALVDPMSGSTAIPYLNELAQIVSQRVKEGVPWEAVSKFVGSLLRVVSGNPRSFAVGVDCSPRPVFDKSLLYGEHSAQRELREACMRTYAKSQQSSSGSKTRNERDNKGGDPDGGGKAPKHSDKRKYERKAGVEEGPAIDKPASKEAWKEWRKSHPDGKVKDKMKPACFEFNSPQGCCRGASCSFFHGA